MNPNSPCQADALQLLAPGRVMDRAEASWQPRAMVKLRQDRRPGHFLKLGSIQHRGPKMQQNLYRVYRNLDHQWMNNNGVVTNISRILGHHFLAMMLDRFTRTRSCHVMFYSFFTASWEPRSKSHSLLIASMPLANMEQLQGPHIAPPPHAWPCHCNIWSTPKCIAGSCRIHSYSNSEVFETSLEVPQK